MRTVPVRLDVAASPRVTLTGFVLLAGAILGAPVVEEAAWLIATPLALLALNLAAALWRFPRLRRAGLGLFHLCLLGCLLLLAWGRLTHFDGRVVIVDGQDFDPDAVETAARGPWHGDGLHRLQFRQLGWSVGYAPGVRRERTQSRVQVAAGGAADDWQVVGDDRALRLDGYRLYTTHNKGFAPVLTWTATGGQPVTGAIMLPSFPANDWQQVQRWTAPGDVPWQFSLRVPPVDESRAWTLEPGRVQAVLIAESAGLHFELRPGEVAATPAGMLRYEWLSGWMGYRIFYDSTLLPLLALSLLGVAGLAWHLWARGLLSGPTSERMPA